MKALRFHEFGTPSHAVLEDVSQAAPGVEQVSVRIEAASVNPLDLKIISGHMQGVFPVTLPYTPGTDFAGVVDAVGAAETGFKPGDRVMGRLDPSAGGAFAQWAVVPALALCRVPAGMSFEQAAAMPTAAGTARLALFEVGQLVAGQRVLIHAAAGGVGSFAVQLARQAGAHVTVTASAPNHALVRELGAHEVIDYRREDFASVLQSLDLVIDTIGGDTGERSWQVLRPGGTLVSIVDHAIDARGDIDGRFAFFRHDATVLDGIVNGTGRQRLQVILDSIHPLVNARAALAQVAQGHARGKVIIRTSQAR